MKLSSGDINRDKPKTSVFDRTNVTQNLDLIMDCKNIMCQKILRKLFIGFYHKSDQANFSAVFFYAKR